MNGSIGHTLEMMRVVVLHAGHRFCGVVNDDQVKTSIEQSIWQTESKPLNWVIFKRVERTLHSLFIVNAKLWIDSVRVAGVQKERELVFATFEAIAAILFVL